MKRFLPILLLLAAALPAAAVMLPLRIPFQSKLIDPATNNPKNGTFSMQFNLYTAPTGGAPVFTETQNVTVTNGVFSVQIGTVSLLSPDLFSGASAYLGVTVGADSEMLPRQPLSMSPYAFTAMQLVGDRDIRVNAGAAYSTFTSAGNLTLQYGVAGTTASFTATGNNQFSITSSSGISMLQGTLNLDPASRGLDATGTGIVAATATFATVNSTGVGTFGITTSSGISMGDGALELNANAYIRFPDGTTQNTAPDVWIFLGSATVVGATSIVGPIKFSSVTTHIHCEAYVVGMSGTGIPSLQFGTGASAIDTAANYCASLIEGVTLNATAVSVTAIRTSVITTNVPRYIKFDIYNGAATVKRLVGQGNSSSVVAATAPTMTQIAGLWINTTGAINKIQMTAFSALTGTTARTLTTGSQLTCWGRNDQ